jgi:hypothetical protein
MNLQTIVACIFLKLIKVNCRQENIGKQHSLPLNKRDQLITFETLPSTRETYVKKDVHNGTLFLLIFSLAQLMPHSFTSIILFGYMVLYQLLKL